MLSKKAISLQVYTLYIQGEKYMVNIAPVSTEPTTNNLGVWLSNPIKKLYSGLFSQEEYPTKPEPPLRYVEEKKVNLPIPFFPCNAELLLSSFLYKVLFDS